MHIICSEIHLKNFRCFDSITVTFDSPIMLIEGINGAGKTSLLEALYYSCYLRSFRTHLPREIVYFEKKNFFVRIIVTHDQVNHEIQVGFSSEKRSVKIDKKAISSYKELMDLYRVVSLIEEDLSIIQEGPQKRRSFLDQTLLLFDTSFATTLREFKKILNNRTRLIQQLKSPDEHYQLWTEQLWTKTEEIQKKRIDLLALLTDEVNLLLATYFKSDYEVSCVYLPKYIARGITPIAFLQENSDFFFKERKSGHSMLGAHLEDFDIIFQNKKTKRLASRGQQKLVLVLLKVAKARFINKNKGPILFLLDDFISDFDIETIKTLLAILYSLDGQLIFTSPTRQSLLSTLLPRGSFAITQLDI